MPIDENENDGWDGVDPEKSWRGWRFLPVGPPEGHDAGSGHYRRDVFTDAVYWVDHDSGSTFVVEQVDAASQSPRAMTSPRADSPGAPNGPSRARRAGFRLGRILGLLVKGLVSLRGMNKKQELDRGEGYFHDDQQ